MADVTTRLVKYLQSEAESQLLRPGLVQEIFYQALCGTPVAVLYSLAMHSGAFSLVARGLKIMQCPAEMNGEGQGAKDLNQGSILSFKIMSTYK